jgi:uncharacterized membrane protein
MRRRSRDEAGQVMLLMVFFAVIVAGLITVVVDVSTVFLAQRQLQSTADGAALAAAQQADLPTFYSQPVGVQLPVSGDQAAAVADAYSTVSARVPHACSATTYAVVGGDDAAGNASTGLQADGQTVRVELTCKVPLPFVSLVASTFTDGVTIDEAASARAAVAPIAPIAP